jgi:hypothetical protein
MGTKVLKTGFRKPGQSSKFYISFIGTNGVFKFSIYLIPSGRTNMIYFPITTSASGVTKMEGIATVSSQRNRLDGVA